MNRFGHGLFRLLLPWLLLGALSQAAPAAGAATEALPFAVSFERSGASAPERIHATMTVQSQGGNLVRVLVAMQGYAQLHSWIEAVVPVAQQESGVQELEVRFKFPWPLGRQWSRVEVKWQGDAIVEWHQTAGSIRDNSGRMTLVAHAGTLQVDYNAVMDVGLPDALTRSYKKKFVTEFLSAAYVRATEMTRRGRLLLAAQP